MAGMDILKQAGASVIGMVEKAVIEIQDERIKDVQIVPMGGNAYGVKSNLTNVIKIASSMETLENAVTEMKRQALGEAGVTKRFVVRFNPSSLSLQAQGGGRVAKSNFATGANSSMEYGSMTPRIQMGVELIFDAATNDESFMQESLTLPKNLVMTAVKAGTKKNSSVQNQVEGFIAALRNPYTRAVTFNWGKLSYTGQLNYLDANYTMFSKSGRPVRAVVSLGILCVDESIGDGNMGQWEDAFEEAFGDPDSNGTNLKDAGQTVGSLFNINL